MDEIGKSLVSDILDTILFSKMKLGTYVSAYYMNLNAKLYQNLRWLVSKASKI